MFFNHFHLNAQPFAENLPIQWLLNDERFGQAMARLTFFLEQGNLALITGPTGIGKSSLLRLFKQALLPNRYQPIYLHLTDVGPISFLRMMVARLGESPKLGKDRLFHQIIERIKNNETDTLLMIDEAHLISSQTLTDLRLLISSDLDKPLPVKIVLCGQESLSQTLKRSALADLVHRICVRFRLSPLTKTQTAAYMDHRIRCAGGAEKLFEESAKTLIHDYAGGVPRQINNIATACLIHAASKNLKMINEQMVNETMTEFHLP